MDFHQKRVSRIKKGRKIVVYCVRLNQLLNVGEKNFVTATHSEHSGKH